MYNDFLKTYSFEFLSNIDIDVHMNFLNVFFSLNKKDNLIFFDVGANSGSFVKCVNSFNKNINTHCFEPHPILNEYLEKNYSNIIVSKYCLSDISGESILNMPSISVGLSSLINRDVFDDLNKSQEVFKLNVKTITIDKYCVDNNIDYIDYIKIDVEGAEFMVLKGAEEMLKKNKIFSGQFEVGIEKEIGININDIIEYLELFNYKIYKKMSNDYFFKIKDINE